MVSGLWILIADDVALGFCVTAMLKLNSYTKSVTFYKQNAGVAQSVRARDS